ncbi:unnamed protein product [Symbiodinium sp. CCMP2456]|nr:unnamed protein product [Symbiodinium sp. CCMP2456]
MTHARAAVVGAQASAALLKVSNLLVAANKQKRSAIKVAGLQKSRSAKKLEDVQRAKETDSSLVLSTKPSGKRLTAQATLALGIRRNIAHVAAADFGALLMQDLSGSTVLRAEVRTGAALVASMRDHVSTAMSLLRESSEFDAGIDVGADGENLRDIAYVAGRWHLLFISVRADATNSSIWRREKLHVTEAEIGLVQSSVKDFPKSCDEFLNVRRFVNRLRALTLAGAGLGLGVQVTYFYIMSDLQVVSGCTAEHCAGILQKQLNSIGVPSVSDIVAELDREKLDCYCLLAFAEFVKIRDMGRRYPLSVSSGRWGSVETAEEFFLERGRSLVEPCMLQVLSRSMKADRESVPATGDGKDEGTIEEDEADSKAAYRHFMLFVQKGARDGQCMFNLVTGKLEQITKEFQVLFENLPGIVSQAMSLSGCLRSEGGLSDSDVVHMRYIALRILLMHWAAFRRRIIRPLEQFPWKLFWLIKAAPKQFSQKRKDVARELLGSQAEQLDPSTRKLRILCDRELRHMAENGTFSDVTSESGSFLYAFLKSLARMQPVDTQAIEGINSVIKLVGRRCPNISLELLSARLAIKRALSEDGSMRRSKKWSKIRSSAEGLLRTILGYNTAALAILSCRSRWSVPLPVECRQQGEGGAVILTISDVQAVKSTRTDVSSLSLPALPAVASIADPPCLQTPEGSDGVQPESEVGRNTPQSQAEFFRTMTTPDAIAWAKSYNLGWRRATAAVSGNRKKKNKTTQDTEASTAQSQSPRGMLLAVFQSSGTDKDVLHQVRDTLVYAVAEKFSVSAMFTRIDVMQQEGGHCLRWNYQEHNCIESTLLMTTFYAECFDLGKPVNVGYVVLSPDQAQRIMTGTVQGGDVVRVESVLENLKPCFVMTQDELPRPGPSSAKPSSRRGQKRAKAKATRGKAKGRAKSKAKSSSASAKRQHQELEDGSEHGTEGSDVAPDALDRYLQDDRNLLDEEEYQSDSDVSLFAEDTAADLPAAEIKKATVAAGAAGPSKAAGIPSSDMVRETAERLGAQAQLTPPGDLEEEALLLLVRRAMSQQNKSLAAGSARGRPDHLLETGGRGDPVFQSALRDIAEEEQIPSNNSETESEADFDEADDSFRARVATLVDEFGGAASRGEVPGQVFAKWAASCSQMLLACKEFSNVKEFEPGRDRSISLVMLRGQDPVPGCKCVRCKFSDSSQEIMWAHWVYNTASKQVLLDDEHKVVFSTPDSSMARTGVSSGMGFPELCLDADHADVLLPYVGACVKKLKKNDPYRDKVPSHFRRLKSLCDVMASNIASHDAKQTSASLATEE